MAKHIVQHIDGQYVREWKAGRNKTELQYLLGLNSRFVKRYILKLYNSS